MPTTRKGAAMIVYGVLALLALAFGRWLFRSPVLKQLLHGRGTDPAQYGNRWDHLQELGSGTGWNDDGSAGKRASRRVSKQAKPRH
jgi:hypothetical protein